MIDYEDDATPLLNNFFRGSSLRTATRRKGGAHPHPRDNVHAKPPLPPRPPELLLHRLRSHSVTEGEDNWGRVIFPQDDVAGQTQDSEGCGNRVAHHSAGCTQLPCSSRAAEHSDGQGHANGGSFQRNGQFTVSLPLPKKPRSGFLWKLSSPLAARRAKAKNVGTVSSELDVSDDPKLFSHTEKSATSYRRPQPQLPPRSAILPPPYTHKATTTKEETQCKLTRHDSIPRKKTSYSPQQVRSNVGVRSTSFRHHRASQWPNVSDFTMTFQAERICNNSLPSPGVGHVAVWGREAPLGNHRDVGCEQQQQQHTPRGLRRHSSLPRPALASRDNTVVSVAAPRVSPAPHLNSFFSSSS